MAFTIGSQKRLMRGGSQPVMRRLLTQSLGEGSSLETLAYYSGSHQAVRRTPVESEEGSADLLNEVMAESMASVVALPRPTPNAVEMERLSAELRSTIFHDAEMAVSVQANQEYDVAWELLSKPRLI